MVTPLPLSGRPLAGFRQTPPGAWAFLWGGDQLDQLRPNTPWRVGISLVLGIVFLALGLNEEKILGRFPPGRGGVAYVSVLLSLAAGVQLVLGSNGTWLILLPVVAAAVEQLSPRQRWPVYLAVLASMALSTGLYSGSWENALSISLVFSPAVMFVAVLTNLRMNEQRERERVEQLTVELEGANRQLADYASQVEELATTKERNRLAREIHDNLGHFLTVVNVQLEAARAVLKHDPDKALDALEKAQKLTKEGLTAVRQSVSALRESPLDTQSLVDAITALTEETRSAGIVTGFEIKDAKRRLTHQTKLTLYRVAQEGLTNVCKHAHASRVDVTLDYGEADKVRLVVADNGVGMAVPADTSYSNGFGLIGMRERVRMLGGDLEIETAPGKGFQLTAVLPG
ncbi:MAG: sensor histidine kinase [Anaerolineae bacterium]